MPQTCAVDRTATGIDKEYINIANSLLRWVSGRIKGMHRFCPVESKIEVQQRDFFVGMYEIMSRNWKTLVPKIIRKNANYPTEMLNSVLKYTNGHIFLSYQVHHGNLI